MTRSRRFPATAAGTVSRPSPPPTAACSRPILSTLPRTWDFILAWAILKSLRKTKPGSWAYSILPYVDQEAMWREKDWQAGAAVLICPARRTAEAMPCVPGDQYGNYETGGWLWARTDYGASCAVSDAEWSEYAFANRPKCRNLNQFPDGASNTILVGEKAYDVFVQKDNWYYDESLFTGGSKGTSRQGTALQPDGPDINYKDNWGSAHTAGVQFLFGDGAVHLLNFDIDTDILIGLMSPEGQEVVSPP